MTRKELKLREIIKRFILEQTQRPPSRPIRQPKGDEVAPVDPTPSGDCEGIPIDCPPGEKFNYNTCKCEGKSEKDKERWQGIDPSLVDPVCKDPLAANYVPEGPDTPIHTNNDLCWYLKGCSDPLSGTYYCDNVEAIWSSTSGMDPAGNPYSPPPEDLNMNDFLCVGDQLPDAFIPANDSWCQYYQGDGMIGGIPGCTDPAACNYDPEAQMNDGSCKYLTCSICPTTTLTYDWQFDQVNPCETYCDSYSQFPGLGTTCMNYEQCVSLCGNCPDLEDIDYYGDDGDGIIDDAGDYFGGDIDFCFAAGTLVTMADGTTKPIEEIKIDDKVKSWNEESKELSEANVTELKQPSHSDMVIIEFDHTTNKNTFDHPYWVVGKGWSSYKPQLTEARYNISEKIYSLEVGDTCLLLQEDKLIESKITSINENIEEVQTYIFSLDKDKTFFANGILTHNKTIGEGVSSLHEYAKGPAPTPKKSKLLKEQIISTDPPSGAYNMSSATIGGYWHPIDIYNPQQVFSQFGIPMESVEGGYYCSFEQNSSEGFSIRDGEQWFYPDESQDLQCDNTYETVTGCYHNWVPEDLTGQIVQWDNSPFLGASIPIYRLGGWAEQMNDLCITLGCDESGTPIDEL